VGRHKGTLSRALRGGKLTRDILDDVQAWAGFEKRADFFDAVEKAPEAPPGAFYFNSS